MQMNFKIMLERIRQILFDNDIDTTIRVFGVMLGLIVLISALFMRTAVFLLRLCRLYTNNSPSSLDDIKKNQ